MLDNQTRYPGFAQRMEAEAQMFETSHRFKLLARLLQRETSHFSTSDGWREHPSYQSILAMGILAVPYVVEAIGSDGSLSMECLLHEIAGEAPFFPKEYAGESDISRHIWLHWALRGPGLHLVYRGLAQELDIFEGNLITKWLYHPAFDRLVKLGTPALPYLVNDLATWRKTGGGYDPYWRAQAVDSINGQYMKGIPRIIEGDPAVIEWIISWGKGQSHLRHLLS